MALALIGGVAAAFGTVIPAIAHRFSVSLPTAGLTLSVNFGGALVGTVLCWSALRRFPGGRVLVASCAVLAAGLGLAAGAHRWDLFLAAVALGGVGFGGLDFGLVALVSRTEAEGRASRLSLTGSGWGVGAVVGPLCIAVLRPAHFPLFLGAAAVAALALVPVGRGIDAPPVGGDRHRALAAGRPANRRAVLPTFLACFGAYVALETATGGWAATRLHGWGYSSTVGSLVTAGFWAGLALGRLLAATWGRRLDGRRVVLVGLAAAVVLLLAAGVRSLAPFAYPLVGLALAAVFPLTLHWFTELSPDDHDGVAWIVLLDLSGGVLGSAGESLAVAHLGLRAVPYVAAGFGVVCLALVVSALRFPRHPAPATASP